MKLHKRKAIYRKTNKVILSLLLIFSVLITFSTAKQVSAASTISVQQVSYHKIPIVIIPGTTGTWPKDYLKQINDWGQNHSTLVHSDLSIYFGLRYLSTGDKAARTEASKLHINLNENKLSSQSAKGLTKSQYWTYVNGKYYMIDPFDSTYSKLINNLSQKYGYVKDKNLFVFGYDTIEAKISTNGSNLSKYIQYILKKTGAKKVRIIAHSEGNLVARDFIQNKKGYNYVQQILMVAPPNKGVVKCFGLANFGSTLEDQSNEDTLLSIKSAMTYGDTSTAHKTQWIQEHGLSIKDMIPYKLSTFPTSFTNPFLAQLNNSSVSGYKNMIKKVKISIIASSGLTTLSGYQMTTGTGLPLPQYNTKGDGTVTLESTKLNSKCTYKTYTNLGHIGLINGSSTTSLKFITSTVTKNNLYK